MEFLVALDIVVPDGTSDAEVATTYEREGARMRELAKQGSVLRLWRPPVEPDERRALGLFVAPDQTELDIVLSSLPVYEWATVTVTPLGLHPNDPAAYAE